MKTFFKIFILLIIILPLKVNASTNTAISYVLMDSNTGNVLLSKNMHSPKLIASITNIMTISRLNQKIKDYVISFFKAN